MLIDRDLIRSEPYRRVIETRSLSPSLASHAPKVNRIITKKIEGLLWKNGSIIVKVRTTASSKRRVIRR